MGSQTLVRKVENFDHTLMFVVHPKKMIDVQWSSKKKIFIFCGVTNISKEG
jgi:hypothetical protein